MTSTMSNIIPFNTHDSSPFRQPTLTMSSLEIAELTGKEHRNVMRDIRAMLVAIGERPLNFEQTVERPNPMGGRSISSPCFYLPKRETMILVSGYSMVLRARIVDRWMELEEAVAKPIARTPAVALPNFSNPAEAARAWADEGQGAAASRTTSRGQH